MSIILPEAEKGRLINVFQAEYLWVSFDLSAEYDGTWWVHMSYYGGVSSC